MKTELKKPLDRKTYHKIFDTEQKLVIYEQFKSLNGHNIDNNSLIQHKLIGFTGYQINNVGEIYNSQGDKIKVSITNYGYLCVSLLEPNGVRKSRLIHRLLAIQFIDNPLNYSQINHINAIKHDCRLINLEWCNSKQNLEHARLLGLVHFAKGYDSGLSKLTEQEVIDIVKLRQAGSNITDISKKFCVSTGTINGITTGKTWSHITGIVYKKGLAWSRSSMYGGCKIKGKKHPKSRPIIQLTRSGDFVNEYISIVEASDISKIHKSAIGNACIGTAKSAGGFIWKYKSDTI